MIEIGDYIRTKQGEIAKIVDTNMFNKTIYKDAQDARYYLEDIVKHSKNIIDLIEAGDFVNGYAVRMIDNKLCNFDLNTMEWEELERIKLDGLIETIVTKEQFERASYKVLEEI